MKTRPVVIHVPVVRLPSWRQAWGVAWRMLALMAIILVGRIAGEALPQQAALANFIAGIFFALTFARFGWAN